MSKYISLGNWNKKYFAIIFEIISLILYHLFTGFDFADAYFIIIVKIGKFENHYIIHYLFLYIFVFIVSSVFYLIYKLNNIDKNIEDEPYDESNVHSIPTKDLIYIDNYKNGPSSFSTKFVLLIIFLYVLVEQAFTIFKIYLFS